MENKMPKNAKIFFCTPCDFKCSKKSNYDTHLLTSKHKNRTELNILEQKNAETSEIFACKWCGKNYKARNSLWYHEKKCENILNEENNFLKNQISENGFSDKDLIITLLKQNAEFMKQNTELLEIVKNGTHQINGNNNCNNNSFNLNFFLNETCKDAMNLMDFIDSIQLQLSDLESVGQLGYVKGISNIIVKNLRALDVTQRPIHCSDAKREILYVKDNDVWEKEGPEKNKMQKAVKYIAYKNILLLSKWKEKYPECMQYNSPKNDVYNQINIEAMGGDGSTDAEKMNKIIRNIAKEVIIEK
jgi:hypothetical protein